MLYWCNRLFVQTLSSVFLKIFGELGAGPLMLRELLHMPIEVLLLLLALLCLDSHAYFRLEYLFPKLNFVNCDGSASVFVLQSRDLHLSYFRIALVTVALGVLVKALRVDFFRHVVFLFGHLFRLFVQMLMSLPEIVGLVGLQTGELFVFVGVLLYDL